MKNCVVSFLFCLHCFAIDIGMAKILDCQVKAGEKRGIYKIEIFISAADFIENKIHLKGLITWEDELQGKSDWYNQDKLALNAKIERFDSGKSFRIFNLGDYPPKAILEIKNIAIGQIGIGTMRYMDKKENVVFDCKRLKDPK